MPKRKIVVNAEVDSGRAFPILVNYSNLTSHREGTAPMYLEDIVALRSQLPMKKGVFATHGLTENKILHSQAGSGLVSDGVKYARRKAGDLLEYGANRGIDYASGYAKGKVGDVARKVRGSGFFRSLAGNAVKGIGNLVGDTIKGGSARPANIQRRRPVKSLVYSPEMEMALQPQMEGNGFFRSLAGNAVKGIGNLVGDTIKGGRVRKPKRKAKKAKGKGLVAAGMSY